MTHILEDKFLRKGFVDGMNMQKGSLWTTKKYLTCSFIFTHNDGSRSQRSYTEGATFLLLGADLSAEVPGKIRIWFLEGETKMYYGMSFGTPVTSFNDHMEKIKD